LIQGGKRVRKKKKLPQIAGLKAGLMCRSIRETQHLHSLDDKNRTARQDKLGEITKHEGEISRQNKVASACI